PAAPADTPQSSPIGGYFATSRTTDVYALALRKDVKHPFPPQSDEVTVAKDEAKKDEAKKDESKKDEAAKPVAKPPLQIDFDGLADRVARVPVPGDNYGGLSANEEHLFFVKRGAGFYGRPSPTQPELQVFSLKERKVATLAENVAGYALSADGKKILVRQGAGLALYDAAFKGKDSKKDVSTAGLFVDEVPKE